ncbi:MAG: CRISPR-associated endoribonuclease Cas6 [Candidatus Ratteibacteria bacterium]
MRIKITLEEIKGKEVVFPVHYNYIIQSFIYKNITPKLADFLHNRGFEFQKRRFKMFVFSRIFSDKIEFSRENIIFGNIIYFYLSSPYNEFLSQFTEHILKKNEFKIYTNHLNIKEVYVMPAPEFNKITKIKMISPLTVYSTLYKEEKRKTYYYSPFEKEFGVLIKENLGKKYEAFYKEKKKITFEIKPEKVNKNCEKIILYKGTVVKGWLGIYNIYAEKEIIKFAYDTGLGAKNSQGFGMFEICM